MYYIEYKRVLFFLHYIFFQLSIIAHFCLFLLYCIFGIPKFMYLFVWHNTPRYIDNCCGILNVTYTLLLHLLSVSIFTHVQICLNTYPHSLERKYSIFPKAHPGKKVLDFSMFILFHPSFQICSV